MSGEMLADAIGGIGDSYILEFAYLGIRRRKIHWWAIAAGLCLIVSVVIVWKWASVSPVDAPPVIVAPPKENVIWGDDAEDTSLNVFDHVSAGEIYITDGLSAALSRSKRDTDVFAVKVIEVTGATKEDVYEKFIKPLGLYEEYLPRGVVFATEAQIMQIQCPESFGLVFAHASKTGDSVLITKRYLDSVSDTRIGVVVYVRVGNVTHLTPEIDQSASICLEVMEQIMIDHGIEEDAEIHLDPYGNRFYADLHKETLLGLLEDQRVSRIWLAESEEEVADL